jgi:uncharacterized protein YqeY
MNFKEKIQTDLRIAVKEKNETFISALRLLLAAILNKEKIKRYKISQEKPDLTDEKLAEESQLTDEEITEVVSSEIKKNKEAIVDFEKGERQDLVKKEKAAIEVWQKYLPEQLSGQELKKLAQEVIKKVGAKEVKDIGKVMAELIPQVKGRAEGGQVSKIVKELLEAK